MSEEPKLNLLVAYPYLKPGIIRLVKENNHRIRFLLDSGAFTAWKAGKPIKLDDYCRFIEALPITPWRYFTLDVIGDPKATLANYETMLKRGFKPIPIFTRGESPSLIEEYYKTSDVVGIGGLVGTNQNKGFVKGIMRLVNSRPVHWLGFTNLSFVKAYRPYMCDSSTWEMGARFAACPLYLGQGQPIRVLKKQSVKKDLMDPLVVTAIERLGLKTNDLLDHKKWNGGYSISRRLGAKSMRHLSHDIERNLKTHMFLAATTDYAVDLLLEGM